MCSGALEVRLARAAAATNDVMPISRSRVAKRPAKSMRSISRPVPRSVSRPRSIASLAARRAMRGPVDVRLDPGAGGGVDLVVRHDLVDQADRQRLLGVHEPARVKMRSLARAGPTSRASRWVPPGAGDDAEQDLGLAELGARRRRPGSRQHSASSQPPPRA